MTLPVFPNPISLLEIGTEFGDTQPHAMSEFVGEVGKTATAGQNVTFSNFHGLSAIPSATASFEWTHNQVGAANTIWTHATTLPSYVADNIIVCVAVGQYNAISPPATFDGQPMTVVSTGGRGVDDYQVIIYVSDYAYVGNNPQIVITDIASSSFSSVSVYVLENADVMPYAIDSSIATSNNYTHTLINGLTGSGVVIGGAVLNETSQNTDWSQGTEDYEVLFLDGNSFSLMSWEAPTNGSVTVTGSKTFSATTTAYFITKDPSFNLATLSSTLLWNYDFAEQSTLYQTADTSTPVTATGQTVKRINNQGSVGGHMTHNGTFTNADVQYLGADGVEQTRASWDLYTWFETPSGTDRNTTNKGHIFWSSYVGDVSHNQWFALADGASGDAIIADTTNNSIGFFSIDNGGLGVGFGSPPYFVNPVPEANNDNIVFEVKMDGVNSYTRLNDNIYDSISQSGEADVNIAFVGYLNGAFQSGSENQVCKQLLIFQEDLTPLEVKQVRHYLNSKFKLGLSPDMNTAPPPPIALYHFDDNVTATHGQDWNVAADTYYACEFANGADIRANPENWVDLDRQIDPSNEPCTIEMWYTPSQLITGGGKSFIIAEGLLRASVPQGGDPAIFFQFNPNSSNHTIRYLFIDDVGGISIDQYTGLIAQNIDVPVHIAVSIGSGTIECYHNGTRISSHSTPANLEVWNSLRGLSLTVPSYIYIDELRITDEKVYTGATITVPTTPFT